VETLIEVGRYDKKDMEVLNGSPDWKVRALDREGWKIGCVTGWS
jgi:hypothetical protein